jgi:hypothetical protein
MDTILIEDERSGTSTPPLSVSGEALVDPASLPQEVPGPVRDDNIIELIDLTGIDPLRETRGEICPTKATYIRVD